MFSPICFTILFRKLFSVWVVENEHTFLLFTQNSLFLSLPVEKEIITNICYKNRRFRIHDWWNYLMSPSFDVNFDLLLLSTFLSIWAFLAHYFQQENLTWFHHSIFIAFQHSVNNNCWDCSLRPIKPTVESQVLTRISKLETNFLSKGHSSY